MFTYGWKFKYSYLKSKQYECLGFVCLGIAIFILIFFMQNSETGVISRKAII